MPTTQIGNFLGVAAKSPASQAIATVVSNQGANAVAVSGTDIVKFSPNLPIDCYSPAGVVRFQNRLVNYAVVANGIMTYTGADAPTVTAGDLIYFAGTRTNDGSSDLNGGYAASRGFNMFGNAITIQSMRDRLFTVNPTYYTSAFMDKLTYNDLVYALRLAEAPGSI